MNPETQELFNRVLKENELLREEVFRLREQVHDLARVLNRYSTCQAKGCDLKCMKEKL